MNNRRLFRQHGQSLVEFAAIAPILILLILSVMEFGRGFYYYATIVNAVSEGARIAITHPKDNTLIKQTVVDSSVLLNLTPDDVTVTRPNGCTLDKPISVSVNYAFSPVTPLIPNLTLSAASTMTIVYVPSSGSCP